MKKFISILAIAAVAALAFVSCKKDDSGNVIGTWTLDYDVLDDNNLTSKEMDRLEDVLDDMVEGVVYEDVTLNEVVEEVEAMIKKEGPALAAQYPDKYFTVQFGIVNDKDEWVKEVYAKCKDGMLL